MLEARWLRISSKDEPIIYFLQHDSVGLFCHSLKTNISFPFDIVSALSFVFLSHNILKNSLFLNLNVLHNMALSNVSQGQFLLAWVGTSTAGKYVVGLQEPGGKYFSFTSALSKLLSNEWPLAFQLKWPSEVKYLVEWLALRKDVIACHRFAWGKASAWLMLEEGGGGSWAASLKGL